MVLGSLDHGWVSAKQAWYMRELDVRLKKQWDDFMESEEKRFDQKVQEAKAGKTEYECEDGHIEERWESFQKPQEPQKDPWEGLTENQINDIYNPVCG